MQLIRAAHPRDHLLVLVLIALRIRRNGQDQQRAHRWDFDRMATALQQGSAERVAFLEEAKALTEPSAEDSWRLWIQLFFEIDKRYVSVWEKRLHRWIPR